MKIFKNRLLKSFKGESKKDDAEINYSLMPMPDGNLLRSTDFLSSLDLLCEGEIEGFVNSNGTKVDGIDVLQAVYLNDTPILKADSFTAPDAVTLVDVTPPTIIIAGYNPQTILIGEQFVDDGANTDGNETISAVSNVDNQTAGSYTVTYSATDASGNTGTATRIVNVVASLPPVITILGNNPETIEIGSTYTDAGATSDGGETVTVLNGVDSNIVNLYRVIYSATNSAGTTSVFRVVVVEDSQPPIITISGENPLLILKDSTYTDAGATSDGGETVTSTSTVNTSTEGVYTVAYFATDAAGNAGTTTRTVEVIGDNIAGWAWGAPGYNGDIWTYNSQENRWESPTLTTGNAIVYLFKSNNRWVLSVGNLAGTGQVQFQTSSSYTSDVPLNIPYSDWAYVGTSSSTSTFAKKGFIIRSSRYPKSSFDLRGFQYGNIAIDGVYSFDTTYGEEDESRYGHPTITSPNISLALRQGNISNSGYSGFFWEIRYGSNMIFWSDELDPINDINKILNPSLIQMTNIGSGNGPKIIGEIILNDAPVITVSGNNPETVILGSTYTDAGATSNGPEAVTSAGTVNTSAAGVYTVTYSATNSNGFTSTATRTVNVVGAPIITISGNNPETVEFGGTYTDAGATSDGGETVTSVIFHESSTSKPISAVSPYVLGTNEIIYSATNSNGITGTATRIVNVVDTTVPIITITGDNPLYLVIDSTYLEAGATSNGGETITESGTVNMSVEGTYSVTYSATDAVGNTGTATRTVEVIGDGLALFAFGHPYVNGNFYEYQPQYNRWKGTPTDGSSYRVYIHRANQNATTSDRWLISIGNDFYVGSTRYASEYKNMAPGTRGISNSPVNLDWNIFSVGANSAINSEYSSAPNANMTKIRQWQIGFVVKSSQYFGAHLVTSLPTYSYPNIDGAYDFTASFLDEYNYANASSFVAETVNLGNEGRSAYGRFGADGSGSDSSNWYILQLMHDNNQSVNAGSVYATRQSQWRWRLFTISRLNSPNNDLIGVPSTPVSPTFESPVLTYPDDIDQILDPTGLQLAELQGTNNAPKLEINSTNAYDNLTFFANASETQYTVVATDTGTGGHIVIPKFYDDGFSGLLPVKEIGYEGFADCTNLLSISIPDSVTVIGQGAFSFCTNLHSIRISNSVTRIRAHTFFRCDSLTNVVIPNSVTEIEFIAFQAARGLRSVTIGTGVQEIGNQAFQNCLILATINSFPTSAPSLGSNVFNNTAASSINIPIGASASYQAEGYSSSENLTLNDVL